MDFYEFCQILNKHIFKGEKKDLLRKIAEYPERFIGLFRPTKPQAKILQNLLQSHEIRMGDALEEIIEKILEYSGYENLPKNLTTEKGENLSLDQYFRKNNVFYFVEQKVRDDHDSSKKRGQILNFKLKLNTLYKKHQNKLIGIIYFIDPDFSKNKNYYQKEIEILKSSYDIEIYLFYGCEFFRFIEKEEIWNDIIDWLKEWKSNLPESAEVDFDASPKESFDEIKDLDLRYWKKILYNDKLWEEGIIKVLSKDGKVLKLLLDYFKKKDFHPYQQLARKLEERLKNF